MGSHPAAERAACLKRFADLLEQRTPALMMLAVREAGKTLTNAPCRSARSRGFRRYYAREAEHTLANHASGRGVMIAISPWNFPLAIFTGETIAALAAGNTVVAKPPNKPA